MNAQKDDAYGQLEARLMPAAAVERICTVELLDDEMSCAVTILFADGARARFDFQPGQAITCGYITPAPTQRARIRSCSGI